MDAGERAGGRESEGKRPCKQGEAKGGNGIRSMGGGEEEREEEREGFLLSALAGAMARKHEGGREGGRARE